MQISQQDAINNDWWFLLLLGTMKRCNQSFKFFHERSHNRRLSLSTSLTQMYYGLSRNRSIWQINPNWIQLICEMPASCPLRSTSSKARTLQTKERVVHWSRLRRYYKLLIHQLLWRETLTIPKLHFYYNNKCLMLCIHYLTKFNVTIIINNHFSPLIKIKLFLFFHA